MDAQLEEDLVAMGIASPVTKATAGALYHQELSRQARSPPQGRVPYNVKMAVLACDIVRSRAPCVLRVAWSQVL